MYCRDLCVLSGRLCPRAWSEQRLGLAICIYSRHASVAGGLSRTSIAHTRATRRLSARHTCPGNRRAARACVRARARAGPFNGWRGDGEQHLRSGTGGESQGAPPFRWASTAINFVSAFLARSVATAQHRGDGAGHTEPRDTGGDARTHTRRCTLAPVFLYSRDLFRRQGGRCCGVCTRPPRMLQDRARSGRPGAQRAGHCASAGSCGTVRRF